MKTLFVSVMMILTAGTVQAASAAGLSASLSKPVAQTTHFVVGETAWTCSASECEATVISSDSNSWMVCRALARKVGPVTAYGSLDAAALAKMQCGRRAEVGELRRPDSNAIFRLPL